MPFGKGMQEMRRATRGPATQCSAGPTDGVRVLGEKAGGVGEELSIGVEVGVGHMYLSCCFGWEDCWVDMFPHHD